MAGLADNADARPARNLLALGTAAGCILAAYVLLGAPGITATPLARLVPPFDAAQGWLPAAHLGVCALALAGGSWLVRVLRAIAKPGALPLTFFAVFQFALLFCALSNLAMAAGALRTGGSNGPFGALLLFPALAALRLHSELYLAVLRFQSWVGSLNTSERGPVAGGALIALTVASNLVPLALCFQAITTHSGAVLSSLFRRSATDPTLYANVIWSQISTINPQEAWLAFAALAASAALGGLWSLSRSTDLQRLAAAEKLAAKLSPEQRRYVDDALPAAVDAVRARASSRRFTVWAFFWILIVAPLLLTAAYASANWFGVLQEQHALSWTARAASDLAPFASGEAGWAHLAIPFALILFVLTMNAPMADSIFSGARYDRFAFGHPIQASLRAKLLEATEAGTYGPNIPFDAGQFADAATRPRYWIRIPLFLAAAGVAAITGFWDVARGVAFTGDGLIVQDHFFAPPKLVTYYEVKAVALDCRIGPLGAKPVYELTLPDWRVVNMVGAAPLPDRLDQYLAVDARLQFSGVGYAYPPGDLEPCLKAIQAQHNSVIAAGTARLLHVLD